MWCQQNKPTLRALRLHSGHPQSKRGKLKKRHFDCVHPEPLEEVYAEQSKLLCFTRDRLAEGLNELKCLWCQLIRRLLRLNTDLAMTVFTKFLICHTNPGLLSSVSCQKNTRHKSEIFFIPAHNSHSLQLLLRSVPGLQVQILKNLLARSRLEYSERYSGSRGYYFVPTNLR